MAIAVVAVFVLVVDVLVVQEQGHVHSEHKNLLVHHSDHYNKDNASLYPPFFSSRLFDDSFNEVRVGVRLFK